jgi:hypothetical protein
VIDKTTIKDYIGTWWLSAIMLPICAYFVFFYPTSTFMDNADLLIHEAGHFFFGFFGQFIRVLGGTIMQIVLPGLLIWHFFAHGYRTGTQIALFWLGHNLLNIAVYASDARTRQLPLLGGNKSGHDWHYLLGRLGLLEFDQAVGTVFAILGAVVFLILIILPQYAMWSGSEES